MFEQERQRSGTCFQEITLALAQQTFSGSFQEPHGLHIQTKQKMSYHSFPLSPLQKCSQGQQIQFLESLLQHLYFNRNQSFGEMYEILNGRILDKSPCKERIWLWEERRGERSEQSQPPCSHTTQSFFPPKHKVPLCKFLLHQVFSLNCSAESSEIDFTLAK